MDLSPKPGYTVAAGAVGAAVGAGETTGAPASSVSLRQKVIAFFLNSSKVNSWQQKKALHQFPLTCYTKTPFLSIVLLEKAETSG